MASFSSRAGDPFDKCFDECFHTSRKRCTSSCYAATDRADSVLRTFPIKD